MSNVISEKQQKTTLRGKKGKKETVKNVLASPYTHYWPLIKNEDDNSLKQILKCNLPKIKEQTKTVPWEEIKHVPKEARKEYRKKLLNLDTKPIDPASKYMYFGINEVTKLLEKDEAISVLLTSDVTPQLMIKHVVDLCVFKRVAILVVPNLKQFLKETVGISSAVIAFKKNIQCDSKIYLIHKVIVDMSINYPVPEKHAFSNLPDMNLFASIEKTKEDEIEKKQLIENVYLYRDSVTAGRVFVPKNSNKNRKYGTDKMEVDSTGFLSFSDSVASESTVDSYKSLIVKRIRNNLDRNKRKLEMIKNKHKKLKIV